MIKYHLLTNGLKPHAVEAIIQLIKAFRSNEFKPHAIEAIIQLIKAFRSVRQKYMT